MPGLAGLRCGEAFGVPALRGGTCRTEPSQGEVSALWPHRLTPARLSRAPRSLRSLPERLASPLPILCGEDRGSTPTASRMPCGVRRGPSPIFRAPKASLVQTGCPSAPPVLDSAPPVTCFPSVPVEWCIQPDISNRRHSRCERTADRHLTYTAPSGAQLDDGAPTRYRPEQWAVLPYCGRTPSPGGHSSQPGPHHSRLATPSGKLPEGDGKPSYEGGSFPTANPLILRCRWGFQPTPNGTPSRAS